MSVCVHVVGYVPSHVFDATLRFQTFSWLLFFLSLVNVIERHPLLISSAFKRGRLLICLRFRRLVLTHWWAIAIFVKDWTLDFRQMFWWCLLVQLWWLVTFGLYRKMELSAWKLIRTMHWLTSQTLEKFFPRVCVTAFCSTGSEPRALQSGGQMIPLIWASVEFFTEITVWPKGLPPCVLRKPDTVQHAASPFLIPRLYDLYEPLPSVWTAVDCLPG